MSLTTIEAALVIIAMTLGSIVIVLIVIAQVLAEIRDELRKR
jgi:hypothetical protein